MTKEEVAEECGYEKKKAVLQKDKGGNEFIVTPKEIERSLPEDGLKSEPVKEYWFNNESEAFYENTEKGLTELCIEEGENAKSRVKK